MQTYTLDLPVPSRNRVGSDEQTDTHYAHWLDSFDHAYADVSEDPEYDINPTRRKKFDSSH